jgi:hypothetical protein
VNFKIIPQLALAGFLCQAAFGQIVALESQYWDCSAVAQDTNGAIYTSPPGDGRGWFARWENDRRSTTGSDFGPGAKLAWLQRGHDGGVYGLWDCDDHTVSVSFAGLNHVNSQPRVQGPASQAQIFDDSKGKTWVADGGLNIYRYDGRKRALIHTVTSDEMSEGGSLDNSLPVSIAEDGRGRMWFWSDGLMDDTRKGAVRGVLVFDGDTLTHHASLPGVPGKPISVIYKINQDTFWLAAKDAGIYSINMETLKGAVVSPPEPEAFRVVQKIFSSGDDVYVIAGGAEDVTSEGMSGTLWRRRDGVWSEVVAGLDRDWRPRSAYNRDWLATADGLWLGASGSGGWFLPKEGAPRPVDWHVNSPLRNIDRWMQLPDGKIGGIEFNHGGISIRPASLLETPPPAAGVKIIGASRPFVETESGVIFGFLKNKTGLSVWDGARWQLHPFPKNFSWNGDLHLATDSLDRLWWIPLSYSTPDLTPGWIFDPAKGSFEKFESYSAALEAQLPRAAKFFVAKGQYYAPKFSRDGQICFEDQYWKLHYFNGHKWREWQKHDIGPLSQQLLHPFFDEKNILTVLLDAGPFQFTEIAGWHASPGVVAGKNSPATSDSAVPLPQMAFTPDSIATDRLGTRWFTHDGQLYRAGYGLVSPWFKPGDAQPFDDGSRLKEVLLDKNGNAFARIDEADGGQYIFLPSGIAAKTSVQVEESADGVVMRLAASGLPCPRFSWRQDDGPWSEASGNKVVALEIADRGTHHVQAIAIGNRLQTDGTPAEAIFEVRADPTLQIQKLIAQLDDKEFARREAAVAALARVPDLAHPALKKALEERHEGDRWWLEAALREVEDAAQKSGHGGE